MMFNFPIVEVKICSHCNDIKPLSEFHRCKRGKDQFQYWCKRCKKEAHKKWDSKNVTRKRECAKKWDAEHLDRRRAYDAKWKSENVEQRRVSCRKYDLIRHNTPKGKLNNRMKVSIYQSLKSNSKAGRHWEDLVGFTLDQLKQHIEKQFLPGMTWENRNEWHIDHKIPISAFNFEKPEDMDFKKCWALKNLQPLWAIENMSKGTKIKKPFQPSLIL